MKNVVYSIILAAGCSSRMRGTDKIFEKLANGKEVIINTIYKFDEIEEESKIIVVTRKNVISDLKNLIKKYNFKNQIFVIEGGLTRTQSLFNGFDFVNQNFILTDDSYCLVHDGARPLISKSDILNCLEDAVIYKAAALGVKINNTVKKSDGNGFILKTIDRTDLFSIQTPQIFKASLLNKAVINARNNNLDFTDDCQLIESIGEKVYISAGSQFNIKITTPQDLLFVNNILKAMES